ILTGSGGGFAAGTGVSPALFVTHPTSARAGGRKGGTRAPPVTDASCASIPAPLVAIVTVGALLLVQFPLFVLRPLTIPVARVQGLRRLAARPLVGVPIPGPACFVRCAPRLVEPLLVPGLAPAGVV